MWTVVGDIARTLRGFEERSREINSGCTSIVAMNVAARNASGHSYRHARSIASNVPGPLREAQPTTSCTRFPQTCAAAGTPS